MHRPQITAGLQPNQAQFVRAYYDQGSVCGYKEEFVLEICREMAQMYREKFDAVLPPPPAAPQTTMEEATGEIPTEPQASRDPSRTPGNHMVTSSEWQELRQRLENEIFPQYFATRGGNYDHIKKLFLDQIASSFSNFPMAFKYYLMSQHTTPTDSFYLGKNFSKNPPVDYTIEDFEVKFRTVVSKDFGLRVQGQAITISMNENTFRKSIILHKAMTAIALNKLELPGFIDHAQYKLRVRRGIQKLGSQQRFPGSRKGSMVMETKNGIGESTSLGTPPPNWTYGRSGKKQVVTKYEVPFCNVHSLFCLHSVFSTFPSGRPQNSNDIANQHEILCSLHNTESKIIFIS